MALFVPHDQEDMCLYYNFRWPDSVPDDVPWDELTDDQKQVLVDSYRYSGYRPGKYQGISGLQGMC